MVPGHETGRPPTHPSGLNLPECGRNDRSNGAACRGPVIRAPSSGSGSAAAAAVRMGSLRVDLDPRDAAAPPGRVVCAVADALGRADGAEDAVEHPRGELADQ